MRHWELIIFGSYAVLGPLVWTVYGYLLTAGRRKLQLMKWTPIAGQPPHVTILVPAKDEGERIRACIESALAQDYPRFDVIAIDDRSTDNTGAVMDQIAASHRHLSVLHITSPPEAGWTGKNNALHQGAKQARGEWLLFVDSDVILHPDALRIAISVLLRKKFDMLSLIPRIESHTAWEGMLIPLCGAAASTMYLIALNNNSQLPSQAFANGQFLLVSRSAYDSIGGHETVRDRYCEDVEIARLMKARGLRPRVSLGNDHCSVRMYSSLGAIIRGWSRIYYAARVGSPSRIVIALLFLLLCCFTVYPALIWAAWRMAHPVALQAWAGPLWLIAAAVHLALMTYSLGRMYKWSGNSRLYALIFPVAGSLLAYTFLKALKMCVTKKVEWRGTAYSHTMQEIPHQRPPAPTVPQRSHSAA